MTANDSDDWVLVDLRRSICEATERGADLVAERYALEEVRDGIEAMQRDLFRRVAVIREEGEKLEAEIEVKTRRSQEIMTEVEVVRREIRAKERECTANALHTEDFAREAEGLSEALRVYQDGGAAVQDTLRSVRDSIARMDRKLVFAERLASHTPGSLVPK